MKKICFFVEIFAIFSLASCKIPSFKKTEIHLHDRHVLSYNLVKNFAEKNGACTLVLLDYHHDIHPGQNSLTSVNWAGRLAEEGFVSKIYWLSGRTLLLPNRNSRFDWLERSLKDAYPDVAEKMRAVTELVDWHDLQKIELKSPFVVTLDFDVFTKDTDNAPDDFVEELRSWIEAKKPELVTLAFSASYPKNPVQAWNWLEIFVRNWKGKADWFLESGEFGETAESNDDTKAWRIWNQNQKIFKDYDHSFYSGAYLWLNVSESLRKALVEKKIRAENREAENIISSWGDSDFLTLKEDFNRRKLEEFAELAFATLEKVWAGEEFPEPIQKPKSDSETFGIAVRFTDSGIDRGCLSLYRGIAREDFDSAIKYCAQEAAHDPRYSPILKETSKNLAANISIFSEWEEMTDALDFIPGKHSLIVETESGEKTLLQAAIALERGYTREQFLSRLTRKAGLGEDAWKHGKLKFSRADTINFTYSTMNSSLSRNPSGL